MNGYTRAHKTDRTSSFVNIYHSLEIHVALFELIFTVVPLV